MRGHGGGPMVPLEMTSCWDQAVGIGQQPRAGGQGPGSAPALPQQGKEGDEAGTGPTPSRPVTAGLLESIWARGGCVCVCPPLQSRLILGWFSHGLACHPLFAQFRGLWIKAVPRLCSGH